ncbi:alpha/beta-hydrolase [Peniophora sp. CONT]|nr:alpha/beta-hydrolase [Peniophora sp. CONT]
MAPPPAVKLDNATFIGVAVQNTTSAFLGIPYALPPVGDLRMRPPVANEPYSGTFNATAFGAPCIFQNLSAFSQSSVNPAAAVVLETALGAYSVTDDSEDCLTVNIWTPSNVTPDARLPVLYVRGFEAGSSSTYDGNVIVERSIELGEPVVSVSINYRYVQLLAFPAAEAREAGVGNLGLRDQRAGLHWVRSYINAFGGDPSKVTIWGGSAGAISSSLQMLTNGGNSEGLFRAAFMSSGGPISSGYIEDVQVPWDSFVTTAGCGDFLGDGSVFDCLRNVSLDAIRAAQDASGSVFGYGGLMGIPWWPSSDGDFLIAPPQQLLMHGSVADIPFITGDCDDEGTAFSLGNSNISTSAELAAYLGQVIFPKANQSSIDDLLANYPDDPTLGSPFDTGLNSSITQEYKRVSALTGDIVFQAPRRLFLQRRASKQPAYSYLYKRGKQTPLLGAYHSTDVISIYAGSELLDYLIQFAATLEPGSGGNVEWPQYSVESPQLMTFLDGEEPLALTNDTYRAEAIRAVVEFSTDNSL